MAVDNRARLWMTQDFAAAGVLLLDEDEDDDDEDEDDEELLPASLFAPAPDFSALAPSDLAPSDLAPSLLPFEDPLSPVATAPARLSVR